MAETKTASRYASAAEVAEIIGVSRQALANWRARNFGPRSVKLGGVVRYPRTDLEAWIAEQETQSERGGVA